MSVNNAAESNIRLILEPDSDYTQVAVLDNQLKLVPGGQGIGLHEVDLPPGLYQVVFSAGSETDTQIVKLISDEPTKRVTPTQKLEIASAAPVTQARTSRESHGDLAHTDSLSSPQMLPDMTIGGAHLLLFVRELRQEKGGENPARGLTLHQVNADGQVRLVFNFETDGIWRASAGTVSIHLNLEPGSYWLQVETADGRELRQMLYLSEGWQTQVFLVAMQDLRLRRVDFSSMAVLIVRPGVGFDPASDELGQATRALEAISRGVAISERELQRLLNAEFENPMLGLYGFHLYLHSREIRQEWCINLFENLTGMLGPHPDVLAAGWGALLKVEDAGNDPQASGRLKDALYQAGPISQPPMLTAGWRYLTTASYGAPWLVPYNSLLDRVSDAIIGLDPWLFWEAGERKSLRATPGTLSGSDLPSDAPYMRYASVKMDDLDRVESSSGLESQVTNEGDGEDILSDINATLERLSRLIERDPPAVNQRVIDEEIGGPDIAVLYSAFPHLRSGTQDPKRYRKSAPWRPTPAAQLVERLNYPAITVLSMLNGLERWLDQNE
ncbi:MAG: hypothetical protein QNJ45_07530 [Ardenticatenaceae bacterium]|nr:hypothetical protein [Ardenticatenaceae bacterium]